MTQSNRSVLGMAFAAVGVFFALGAQSVAAQAVVGNKQNAAAKVPMCVGCHGIAGYKASFPTVYSVPKIGGQNAKYIENALLAYKNGDRKHPTMRAIAGSLSDQDIADLAAYYSQAPSAPKK